MFKNGKKFLNLIHNAFIWFSSAVFIVVLGIVLNDHNQNIFVNIIILCVIIILLYVDYYYEFPWKQIYYIKRFFKIPGIDKILNIVRNERRVCIDGRYVFYDSLNNNYNDSIDVLKNHLNQFRIGWWNRPLLYYTLGLREKLNWVDLIYMLLVREMANAGVKCVLMIHQEGYTATADKNNALEKFNIMENGIKRIMQGAPCEIYFSYEFAKKYGTGKFTKAPLHDFVYFDMLYLVRAFANSVLENNYRMSDRLKNFVIEINNINDSHLEAKFNELINNFKSEMNQQFLGIQILLNNIKNNPKFPDRKFVYQEIEKLINIVQNPFHTKRMVNQLANTLDLYPLLHLTYNKQPIILLYWEYEAEKWRTEVQRLRNFKDMKPIILSGNTLRDDSSRPVPVYEEKVAINLRDPIKDIYNKIFNGHNNLGVTGTANIYKLLGWDVDLIFQTWDEVLTKISTDIIEKIQLRDLLSQSIQNYSGEIMSNLGEKFAKLNWKQQNNYNYIYKNECKNSEIEFFYYQIKALETIIRLKEKYSLL